MKQNDLRHILQHADESEVERMARLSPMTDAAAKRRLQDAVHRRMQTDDFTPAEEETYHTKPVRRSFGTIGSAVAACLVIAGTAAGALSLRQGAKPILEPSSQAGELATVQTEALTEAPSAAEVPDETEPPCAPVYDMHDKLGVIGKMLNTVDFYQNVSGTFVRDETAMVNGAGVVTFAVDLQAWESYTTLMRGSLRPDAAQVLAGAAPEFAALATYDEENGGLRIYSQDGRRNYLLDTDGAWYRTERGEARPESEAPVQAEDALQFLETLRGGGEVSTENAPFRAIPADAYCAVECIQPSEYVENYLLVTDNWDITGDILYEDLGRECVVLAGQTTQYAGNFTMYVDEATGCLLYFEARDSAGGLVEWMRVSELAFDADAAPVGNPLAGRTEWVESEHTTERPDDVPALWLRYGTNSHGETYASAGQMHFDRSTYDQLPDLIRFGEVVDEYGRRNDDCFVKKTELFDTFGDDPDAEMSRLMQAHDKTATAVPVATLNVYDIEGETVLYQVVYYDEP